MSESDAGHRVVVDVGGCRCPGTPHASDEVYLAQEASLSLGLAANGAIAKAGDDPALFEVLVGRAFIEYGIIGWTFTDEDGDEYGVTSANIERLLPWGRGGSLVADKATDLYGETVITPLVERSLKASVNGSMGSSTSASRPNRQQRRSSSKSSSRARSVSTT